MDLPTTRDTLTKTSANLIMKRITFLMILNGPEWFIKNVSSSTSHKKTLKLRNYETVRLRDFSFYLFIYEPILIKNYMNANIMNMQIFYLNKYDLKGH